MAISRSRRPVSVAGPPRRLDDPVFQAFTLLRDRLHRRPDPVRARQVPRLARRLAASTSPPRSTTSSPATPTRRCSPSASSRSSPASSSPFRPRFGGYLVAAWLGGIIVNLLLQADFYDIALRDFGLLLAALALARLATAFDRTPAEA